MNFSPRRAKIVATIGPASSDRPVVENLIKAGVDVFRLNFSHGTKEDHLLRIQTIREAAQNIGKPVALLQDLQGPKLRVGRFPGGSLNLEKSAEVHFRYEKDRTAVAVQIEGKPPIIPYNYQPLPREIRVGHRILMDDGNLEVVVTGLGQGPELSDLIQAQVVFGGLLKDHKGMNYPDTKLSIQSFTPKDKEDLLFGMEHNVDYVALSFVRTAEDVRELKRFMHSHKKNIPVVSKIEMADAITNLKSILDITDAVMVARGDLAVEVGNAKVPALQKEIISLSNARGIPVITATQMLESMITAPRPTRAEASDVANAVLDGTDALMLSAESASGKFPVLAVSVMANIILETELRKKSLLGDIMQQPPASTDNTIVEAVEYAASSLIRALGAKAAVCITHTGESPLALARFRPPCPIFAFSDNDAVARRLALVWGISTEVLPQDQIQSEEKEDLEQLFSFAEKHLVESRIIEKGDLIVCSAGSPPLKHGSTNLLKVVKVKLSHSESAGGSGGKGHPDQIAGYRTKQAQFILDQSLCTQCGGCIEVCPNDIFGIENRRVYLKESNCRSCTFDNACMEICPTHAIEVIRLN